MWVVLGVAVLLGIAYRWYGTFLARQVFRVDDAQPTPAHTQRDEVDYIPTPVPVLFGHHFASIAGLGPLLGPAIAVIWGWLPALLWIVIGSIFIGAVHDLGCLVASVRHRARSIADVAADVMGHRARMLFLLFAIFALSLAMGVFVVNIASLFAPGAGAAEGGHVPQAVLPSLMLIVIAATMGVLHYRLHIRLTPLTVAAVLASLFFVWVGVRAPITEIAGISLTPERWTYLLMVYAFVASVLPVWLLLQPRDYVNSFQLYLGMALLLGGVLLANPTIVAPAVNTEARGLQPLFPMLFITVACGAVSGFHSLVASGTTSKQIARESHAQPIAYGGMLTEGLLATLALVAVAAGMGSASEWATRYADWKSAGTQALSHFVHGAGTLVALTGVPLELAKVFVATVAVGFALTTLDSGTRLIRYNVQELGFAWRVAALQKPLVATAIAVGLIGSFALMRSPDPLTGQLKPLGSILWQLFGTSNQLLAGLSLLVVSLYLRAVGRPSRYTALPMVFMLIVTISALIWSMFQFWRQGNWLLLSLAGAILLLAGWLVGEALGIVQRRLRVVV
ncbi:MAG: carbon starvation protein A [bacterium]|nr:carbon starvation protein A [bacterium]MCS7309097.1 carbon starvation protein A [Armatimonadota bacterium]MDW8105599.1 carbon starvation protein A [Armatimonadota bacterium]